MVINQVGSRLCIFAVVNHHFFDLFNSQFRISCVSQYAKYRDQLLNNVNCNKIVLLNKELKELKNKNDNDNKNVKQFALLNKNFFLKIKKINNEIDDIKRSNLKNNKEFVVLKNEIKKTGLAIG